MNRRARRSIAVCR